MKIKFLIAIFVLYFMSLLSLHAQWAKTYGGMGEDEAYSIQQTSDGGYIIAGLTESFEDESGDAWIIKIDPNGNIEWQKTYGKNYLDTAYAIEQTYDGGYVFAGAFARAGWAIWVLKLDLNGEVEWQKSFKGKDYESGIAYSVQQTTDGGYIAAGEFRYGEVDTDVWILKLAPDGTKEWDKTYGGSDPDHAYTLQQTSDGGLVVAGQNDRPLSGGEGGIWVLKLHPSGEIQWQKTYAGEKEDEARSIQQTYDGGYIVASTTYSFGNGDGDIWVLKLDKNGDVEWQKTYGGYGKEEAYSVLQTYDGRYVVAGSTTTYGAGTVDCLVLKLFSNGEIGLPCEFEKETYVKIQKTDTNPAETNVIPVDTNIDAYDPAITPKDSDALVYSLCLGQHILDLTTSSGGTTDPQPGVYIYYHASRIKIRATPEEEYLFSHWSGDVEAIENPLIFTMEADKSVQANFIEKFEEIWEEVKKTPCFIATAAYDSPSHPHVCILRDFKNTYLMTNTWGRKLVGLYYRYSPPAADLITKIKFLKLPVRVFLQPFVVFSYLMLTLGPVATGIFFFNFFICVFAYFIFQKSRFFSFYPLSSSSFLAVPHLPTMNRQKFISAVWTL